MSSAPDDVTLPVAQPAEHLRYARWLDWGTHLGLVVMGVTFAAYVFGWLPPRVPVHELPSLWHHPVAEFQRLTHAPRGWSWLGLMQHGDLAGLLGIAVLAGCSLPALLALVPLYARSGDKAHVVVCLAAGAVMLLAASGVLTAGH